LAEPVWLVKPVSSSILKALDEDESSLVTKSEMQKLLKSDFKELGNFVSSEEDWEIYIRPTYVAMQKIIKSKGKLAEEAQRVINGFRTEHDAVGQHWDMIL
jgi:hypothetical protein